MLLMMNHNVNLDIFLAFLNETKLITCLILALGCLAKILFQYSLKSLFHPDLYIIPF